MRKICRSASCTFPILALLLLAVPAAAQGLSAKEIADRIAATYNVTVLKTEEAKSNGKAVLFVTVMNKGGDSNAAFQVTTLEVDRSTGALISQYRTTPTGQLNEGPIPREPDHPDTGEFLRQWTMQNEARNADGTVKTSSP